MKEWDRTTSKLSPDQIPPEIIKEFNNHLEMYELGNILADYTICIRTISTKKKKRLFGGGIPDQTVQIAIITPLWLVVGAQGDKPDSIGVLSIKLKDAIARDYKDDPGYRIIQDEGLNVSGPYTGRVGMQGETHISYFIGLGVEPAANEFKNILFDSIRKVKE